MIIIGYNYEGYPISIVGAKTIESANAYWQGKGITPHSTKTIDPVEERDNEEMGYVTPILTTEIAQSYDFRHLSDREIVLVSKK